jgi:arylsulfatase A-like enzyme
LLRAGSWLACFLVAAKALSPNLAWWPDLLERLDILLASSWSDALFALACGAMGELILLTCARSNRLTGIVRSGFLVVYALFVVYAVAAIGVFRYFHRPATYNLLELIGNAAAIRSSIGQRITFPIGLALVLVPALYLVLATRRGRHRRNTLIGLALVSVWIAIGWLLYRGGGWKRDNLEHLWVSPHAELLRTTANRITGAERPSFPKDFPPEYMEEFRRFAARGPVALTHFQLPDGVARPKNAIIVVLESIGTKYLGLYGNPMEVTPTLSAEAQHALVFDNIYAHASFTYASFRPINFSVYPGLPWHYSLLEETRPLPETLAAVMQAGGARTAYITSGDLDWGDQRWLLNRSHSFDLLQGAPDLGCRLLSSWGCEDHCAIDRLIQWIEQKPGQPFLAVCWTDQTHDPYLLGQSAVPVELPPDESRSPLAADLSRYLAVLHQTDAQLARIFAALRARGLADDTLVIVTGDHGEAFGDPHSQRGHAWSIYEEEVHVPLMIWNPRLFPKGGRSEVIGGHVDLNPTIADLLDVKPPDEWQGHSLFDPARPERAFFMATAGGNVFGLREADWKYMYDVTSGNESLFNLATDPKELRNLSGSEPGRAREMRERVAAWVTFEDAYLWGH